MSSAQSIQDLLRFLTQTAKIPLPTALKLAKPLHAASLTPIALATTPPSVIQSTIAAALDSTPETDPQKLAKQLSAAAKRAAKSTANPTSPTKSRKRKRASPSAEDKEPWLPAPNTDEPTIRGTVLRTNRAPLLLAFATALLAATMPAQPQDSRLSLAHAMVSAGARARARDLGIERGGSGAAADPAQGYRRVRVMGNDVAVLRREDHNAGETKDADAEPAFWGLDMEALSRSDSGAALPIHTPQAARAYLRRTFGGGDGEVLALLLGALELLIASWRTVLDADALDRRAWGWYVAVRPAVAEGKAGWGGKGDVRLAQVLDLRRGA